MRLALKLAAGAITGSIAIVTEAVHSLIDLVAAAKAAIAAAQARSRSPLSRAWWIA